MMAGPCLDLVEMFFPFPVAVWPMGGFGAGSASKRIDIKTAKTIRNVAPLAWDFGRLLSGEGLPEEQKHYKFHKTFLKTYSMKIGIILIL